MLLQDSRNSGNQQVYALVIKETGDDNDGDWIAWSQAVSWHRVMIIMKMTIPWSFRMVIERSKVVSHNCVWDDRDHEGIKGGTEDGVLLAAGRVSI